MKIKWPKDWIIPILISFTLVNGLIKTLLNFRFLPLLIDFSLLLFLLIWFVFTTSSTKIIIGKIDLVAISLMLIAFICIFNPNIPSLQAGFEGFRKFAFMIYGFFIGRYLINYISLKRSLIFLIYSSIFISLYGIKQFFLPTSLDYKLIDISTSSATTYMMGGHIRAFSTMSGPFHLGLFLMSILLLLFTGAQKFPEYRKKYYLFSIPLIIALIMTVTKSNWFGLIIGIIFLILLNSKHILKFVYRGLIVGVLLLILLLFFIQISSTIPELRTINEGFQAFTNPLNSPTMQFRLELWSDTIFPLISGSPWIGYGTGSAGEGLGHLFIPKNAIFTNAHNIFLKVMFEYGFIGLAIFAIFLLVVFVIIWNVRKKVTNNFLKVVANWSLSFFVAIIATGMVGSILDAYPINLIFWMVLGMSTKLHKIEEKYYDDIRIEKNRNGGKCWTE